jgi:SAM-dependent methyltransferase
MRVVGGPFAVFDARAPIDGVRPMIDLLARLRIRRKNGTQPAGSQVSQEQVAEDFDSLTDRYEAEINKAISFAGSEHAFYIDVKRDRLVELARSHFGATGELDVLDLGCGMGAYHPGLEGVFGSLHGVDVSARSIELATRKHPFVAYESYDGNRLPYADRVLRPNGMAVVFEHNPYNPATQYVVKSCEIDKDAILLRPGKLRGMFQRARFDDVITRTILSVPPKGSMLSAVDRAFGHLPFGAQYYLKAVKGHVAGRTS